MTRPDRVKIVEVGPRDGLQNEEDPVSVNTRVALIERLADAGLSVIEAGSFVHPDWVPQMADSDRVLAELNQRDGITFPVLVPNETGMENALKAGAEHIAVFVSASEGFSQANLNCSIDESFQRLEPVFDRAREEEIQVRGYVSCVVACPYDGPVEPGQVTNISKKLEERGCCEISLGDTTGVAAPDDILCVLRAVTNEIPPDKLALHCHNTYGQAIANIYASLEAGISTIDSSVGGLGGCPYADGATGNVATEDVLYLLEKEGFETGVDRQKIIESAWFISKQLDRVPDSKLAHAEMPDAYRSPNENPS